LTTWLQAEVERLAGTEQDRVLAVFDALDEWFRRPDFECRSFINTLLGIAGVEATKRTTLRDFGVVRATLEGYADEAGATNPREISHQLQILMMGAIVSAGRGDGEAATRARALAELLLERAR
jgi:hypothetical protein